MHVTRRRALVGLAGLAAGGHGGAGRAVAAQPVDPRKVPAALVMVEEPGCPFCARFDAEVRIGYERSPEGRFAPLLRFRIGDPVVAFLPALVYSPTFVLLVAGREVGRILGYPGADLFWMQMTALAERGGFRPGMHTSGAKG
jgi:hypothetical protein